MRVGTIRFLDYWLGVPACAVLTAVRRIAGRQPAAAAAPKRILFLKFIEQGATVLAQDAIARATRAVGRDHVYFCVFESNRAILDVIGTVPPGNIFCIRDGGLLTFAGDFLRTIAAMRARGIDAVIDMEFFSRASAIFSFLSGARIRVGLHRFTGELPYRGDLMTHRLQYLPHLHISELYSVLTEAAFHSPADEPLLKIPLERIGVAGAPPAFTATADEIQRLRARIGATDAPIVILNPNASDLLPLRKWPTERFGELARRLLDRYPAARVVLTGAKSEEAGVARLCADLQSPRVVSMAGQTTLRELLTLYSVADVLVTNDSGPAHFASLTPVRTVVLFGPETPRLFAPRTPETTVIWKELACSPCVSVFNHRMSPCRNNVCMQTITVDEVFDAVAAALGR
jgi:ADP-heptose:LPS heptosyltransferase